MLGRMLGERYEVLEQIGGGGMSLVYKARDLYLNRIVAIKVLREYLTSDEEFVARFRREAQAVASLSHMNIVSIYDVGQDNDIHYLVMEMVEGQNLKELIKIKGRIPLDETVNIIQQICDALEHAHKHKIIHCDIKPHNIILTKDGLAKVTDFGIARAVTTATVTHTGSIMGSVHYFSPEQAKGEIADERSDIYSTGVVLYEMLTGCLPFEGETPISVALKKIAAEYIAPRELNPDIGEAMELVIKKAMDRNPFKRYENAAELKKNLLSAYNYNRLECNNDELEDTISIPRMSRKKGHLFKAFLKSRVWLFVAVIIIGIAAGMWLSSYVISSGEVIVPDMIGFNTEMATDILKEKELSLVISAKKNHPSLAAGRIISQEPLAHTVVKKNTEVKIVVSEGPNVVVIPNVLNLTLNNAATKLSAEGLIIGEITRVYHEQILSGRVVHQEPAGGMEINQGSAVNIIESKGPEPIWVSMPSLLGMNLELAKSILQNYKLVVGIIQPEINYEYKEGIVIRQDPGASSEILQGSVINLITSAGPGPGGGQ